MVTKNIRRAGGEWLHDQVFHCDGDFIDCEWGPLYVEQTARLGHFLNHICHGWYALYCCDCFERVSGWGSGFERGRGRMLYFQRKEDAALVKLFLCNGYSP